MTHMTTLSPNSVSTMSSREIAELTGMRHEQVMRDIRRMLDKLGISSLEFSTQLPDVIDRLQPAFKLPHELTITLAAGYSVAMRHKIVTQWHEPAHRPAAIQAPTTLREALVLALAQEDRIEALKSRTAILETQAAEMLSEGIPVRQIKATFVNIADNL